MLRGLQFLTLAFSVSGGVSLAQPPPPGAAKANPLTATVRAVDVQARTVEVVTGVGLALRVVKFSWNEETQVKVAGVSAAVSALKAGVIVRVEYVKGEGGNLATTIVSVPAPASEGER